MEIPRIWVGFHGDTIAAFIRIRGRMQGLVNMTDEMDQKCQITTGTALVVIPFFEATRVSSIFALSQAPAGHRAGTSDLPLVSKYQ